MDAMTSHKWRARLRRRRGKVFHPGMIRELNLVAMMDMLTVVVVFLLKSYSVSALSIPVGGEIHPPKSTNIIRPQEAVKLTITKIGGKVPGIISVDDDHEHMVELTATKMAELEGFARQRKFLIPELHRSLLDKAEGIKHVASLNASIKFEGKVLVIADKDTPYWLITEVLFTAAEAQFEQYNLVALREKEE